MVELARNKGSSSAYLFPLKTLTWFSFYLFNRILAIDLYSHSQLELNRTKLKSIMLDKVLH